MATRQTRAAITASRKTIQEIESFILHGSKISPFVEAILASDEEAARRLASKAIINGNLIPDIRAWVDRMLPAGFFLDGRHDIEKWRQHKGFEGATDAQKMWLYLMSNQWDDRRHHHHHLPLSGETGMTN